MKLLIDTNILLDVLQDRAPHAEASSQIWKLCEIKEVEGAVNSLSIANIVYIMRKSLTAEMITTVIEELSFIFDFIDLTSADLFQAAKMGWADFEDALQAVSAKRIGADFIITRNVKDFKDSSVPVVTPTDFLESMYNVK